MNFYDLFHNAGLVSGSVTNLNPLLSLIPRHFGLGFQLLVSV